MLDPGTQPTENPRTVRVRQIILDAAVELLVNQGASEVTASRIARDTGVARTTVYRHWPDQSRLLLDTIDCLVAPHFPTTITGDVEADLTTALSGLRSRMAKHPFREIFGALLGLASQDPTYIGAQQRFVNGVLQPIVDVLTAAIERGDVPPTVDITDACAGLAGPLFHQHVMLHDQNIDDRLISDTVEHFLARKATAP